MPLGSREAANITMEHESVMTSVLLEPQLGTRGTGRLQVFPKVETKATLIRVGDTTYSPVDSHADARLEANGAVRKEGDLPGPLPAPTALQRVVKKRVKVVRVDFEDYDVGQPK
jgi:hypothetical protein